LSEPFELTIEKLVYGGDGIGRHNGKVVFVPFSAPGDRLLVLSAGEKKNFIRGAILKVITPGLGRTTPPCKHFWKCGGCHWQHIKYPNQVEAKQQALQEAFHHRFPETRAITIVMRACSHPFGYRSRARMQLRGEGPTAITGFYRRGAHSVEDIENCPLLNDALNNALGSLRESRRKKNKTLADEIEMCSSDDETWALSRLDFQHETILRKKVGEFTYCIQPSSFFQANDYIAPELVEFIKMCAMEAGVFEAFDLFSGAGLFTLPLAKQFAHVTAVESNRQACGLCEKNAQEAGLHNILIECADVAGWLKSNPETHDKNTELILLDPPRTGAGPDVMEAIEKLSPAVIIYVSCDHQTLIRDLASLSPQSYSITAIEGFDMFPQTYHFETITVLKKQK